MPPIKQWIYNILLNIIRAHTCLCDELEGRVHAAGEFYVQINNNELFKLLCVQYLMQWYYD